MADTGKKRKRSDEDTGSKKKSSQSSIAVIRRGRSGALPVIAVTKGIQAPSVSFEAYTNDENEQSIILQSSKHPRLDYTASTADDGLAHYVAIFDASTDTLQVIPAYQTQLRCVLRAAPRADSTLKSMLHQRIALGQEFGTKKAKKAIADKTVNAITTAPAGAKDAVQDAILEEVAAQAGPEVVSDATSQLAAKPIPQPDLEAEKVEDVYPIGRLIPPHIMSLIAIKEWQDKARAEENIQQGHRFTAYRVAALGKSNDVFRLKALRYIGLLLQFNDLLKPSRGGSKKAPKRSTLTDQLSEYPHALVEFVHRKFSDESDVLSKWRLELLHTNICVLALYVDLWEMDVSNIRDDLKLDSKTVVQYYSELGCRISAMTEKERAARNLNKAQASQVKMARLKLPLDFPKPRAGRRK